MAPQHHWRDLFVPHSQSIDDKSRINVCDPAFLVEQLGKIQLEFQPVAGVGPNGTGAVVLRNKLVVLTPDSNHTAVAAAEFTVFVHRSFVGE